MIGKANWNQLIAHELLNRLAQKGFLPQVFITAEAKAIALTQELARDANHDRYIVLRKSKKSYMNNSTPPASGESPLRRRNRPLLAYIGSHFRYTVLPVFIHAP